MSIIWNRENGMLASLSANLPQPRITWENSLNAELSRSGWPVGMFVCDCTGC